MNFIDLIEKKKQGKNHTKEEIKYISDSICNGSVSDAQISAWLMAVCFNGMSIQETADLTEVLAFSGDKVDLGEIKGCVIDKHSTGGVGDKVTITLIPLLAASGISVVKIADKGIAMAAGTIDKLKSIPNFKTSYNDIAIINQVKNIGAIIASQTENMAPSEKKLYSLRSTTDTANSKELIASSILSKKIASGVNTIFVDVKYGAGTFMKTPEEAVSLSNLIVDISKRLNLSVTAVVSSMEEPLGRAIGNSIEVIEAIEFLKGNINDGDLAELTYFFASLILVKAGLFNDCENAKKYLKEIINSGKALEKFAEILSAQGADPAILNSYDKFELPSFKVECASKKDGFVQYINAKSIAMALNTLGGTSDNNFSEIDYSVGIYLNKKSGEFVKKGETLYTIYSNDEEKTKIAQKYCDEAFLINDSKPANKNLVYKIIGIEDEDV